MDALQTRFVFNLLVCNHCGPSSAANTVKTRGRFGMATLMLVHLQAPRMIETVREWLSPTACQLRWEQMYPQREVSLCEVWNLSHEVALH